MHSVLSRSILPAVGATIALAVAAGTSAEPSTELGGFGDFSAASTQLEFDDLGLANGDDVSAVSGVELQLSVGGPAKYYADAFPRESGPGGYGSVVNFWGFGVPYPDLVVLFDTVVHRVGFEARANASDEVAIVLFRDGVLVDEVVLPSRGSDQLYFYGLENAAGFDEMHVDAVANASGAFSLDNLTYEALGAEEPPAEEEPPALPTYACEGFEAIPPLHHVHSALARVLMASLVDEAGEKASEATLPAPPVLHVAFTPHGTDEVQDVTEDVSMRPDFRYFDLRHDGEGTWLTWLLSWRMKQPGTYVTTMESGDPAAYAIAPTCRFDAVVVPPRPNPWWWWWGAKSHHRH